MRATSINQVEIFKLYLDEDSQRQDLVQALRSRNVDLITTTEADMSGVDDDAQLDWATENNRVIYSYNVRDFNRIHTERINRSLSHSGIIIGIQRYGVGRQLSGLLKLLEEISAEQMKNTLRFLK